MWQLLQALKFSRLPELIILAALLAQVETVSALNLGNIL